MTAAVPNPRTKAPSVIDYLDRTQTDGSECWKNSPHWGGFVLHWLEHGAKNTRVVEMIPVWAIHLGVGLHHPCGSLATQSSWDILTDSMLWFCDSILRSTNKGRWASTEVSGDQVNVVNRAIRAFPLLHMNSFTGFIYISSKWVQAP